MSVITLESARHIAKYCTPRWVEMRNDVKNKSVLFRHADDACEVRRVIVNYDANKLSVVADDIRSHSSVFLYRGEPNTSVLRQLLEKPQSFKRLGFQVDQHSANAVQGGVQWQLRPLKAQLKELETTQRHLKVPVDNDAKLKPMLRCYVTDEVLNVVKKMDVGMVECLQLTPNGKGIVHTEKNGGVYWTPGIWWDAGLVLRKSNRKRRPRALCIGSHGRYFVAFTNEQLAYSGPAEFERLVQLGDVRMVAFGGAVDSYVVLFKDGGMAWANVPGALRQFFLERKHDAPQIDYIALGPRGEYFVRSGSDAVYGNLTQRPRAALDQCPGSVKQVSFGEGDSLVARYVVAE